MAKSVPDWVYDLALDGIKAGCNKLVLLEGAPASYAEASTAKGSGGKKLGEIAMVAGDYAVGAGDVSGRKIRVGQKTGVPVTVSGSWDHVALVDTTTSRLGPVTSKTLQAVTAAQTAQVDPWDIELTAAV